MALRGVGIQVGVDQRTVDQLWEILKEDGLGRLGRDLPALCRQVDGAANLDVVLRDPAGGAFEDLLTTDIDGELRAPAPGPGYLPDGIKPAPGDEIFERDLSGSRRPQRSGKPRLRLVDADAQRRGHARWLHDHAVHIQRESLEPVLAVQRLVRLKRLALEGEDLVAQPLPRQHKNTPTTG